jgi:hypothetical protein
VAGNRMQLVILVIRSVARLSTSLATDLTVCQPSRDRDSSPRGTAVRLKPPLVWLGRQVSGVAA